jgi:hypothetical protein
LGFIICPSPRAVWWVNLKLFQDFLSARELYIFFFFFFFFGKVMAGKLRGKSLSLVIGLIGAVGFVLQGYDQAVCNGLLTLGSFIAVFPQIDTVNTTGSQNSHNSTIQGMCQKKMTVLLQTKTPLTIPRHHGRDL